MPLGARAAVGPGLWQERESRLASSLSCSAPARAPAASADSEFQRPSGRNSDFQSQVTLVAVLLCTYVE